MQHSKFLEAPAVSSAENVRRTGLCAGSDFTISYRSCVFFLHSSGARITLEIYGELSERSKVLDSKSSVLSKGPWVRIPPSPPVKSRLLAFLLEAFLMSKNIKKQNLNKF